MIGISEIAYVLGKDQIDNRARMDRYGTNVRTLEEKIGIETIRRKKPEEETSTLAVEAAEKLFATAGLQRDQVECIVVVTQNPDGFGLPHTAAIVQNKLGLPTSCAAFDISLGCSGYVYGLSVITSFMAANDMKNGLLITADPYSKIINEDDRNTAMLFGDGASATWLSDHPKWICGKFDFGTNGSGSLDLMIEDNGKLSMNGRGVFSFSATEVPKSIEQTLIKNQTNINDVDLFIMHQGSRYIVDTIGERIGKPERTPFVAKHYGNTVSSSIPIAISSEVIDKHSLILISGFGVGLSWATTLLKRCSHGAK